MPDVKLAVPMSTAEGGPGVQQIVIAPPRNFVRQQSSHLRYIKGNIDVWSSEECDGALLNGAQAYLTFTYVMLGITLLLCCCMCCGMMLVGVFVASAEQASQQRSRVATEEPRVTELH